jgi:hypothetical protein
MRIHTTIEIERNGDTHKVAVVAEYTPERPPPPCHDHDHPNFSDPGEAEELEIVRAVIEGTDKHVELDDEDREYVLFVCREAPDDEPDPDRAYDEWREENLEKYG